MYIAFCTNKRASSLFIRWFTQSRYSHVALVKDQEIIDATFTYGVKKRSLLSLKLDYSIIEYREVPNLDENAAWEFAEDQIGKPYDWISLLGIFFRRSWTSNKAWFCSELVACALFEGGVVVIRKQASRVTPENLLNSPLIKPIGEK